MARFVELLDFPDEILFSIAEYLDPWGRDLCAFARTCIRLSEVAAPYFYKRLVVRTEGQAKRLSNAIKLNHRRSTFIRELILVPDLEPARHIMLDLYWTLDSMNVLQHLTVELPFHESYNAAAILQYRYQERFGEMFKEASLVSLTPKSCALRSLRSCEYGLQALLRPGLYLRIFPTCPILTNTRIHEALFPVENTRTSPLHFSNDWHGRVLLYVYCCHEL
jgi:hypothetical protein